jgi:hypothetical protein
VADTNRIEGEYAAAANGAAAAAAAASRKPQPVASTATARPAGDPWRSWLEWSARRHAA